MDSETNMKAVVFDRYGPPDTLSIGSVPRPQPAAGEIRIRVCASTVSRTDTATLRAHPFFARAMTGLLRPRMHTLGMDFAGVVDALGDNANGFKIGDRVFGIAPDKFGGHAEYICVAANGAVAQIAMDLPFHEAVVGEGAWYADSTTKQLARGQRCLIYGASGAIGTAAVQLAKIRGAHVTAVVGTRHLELAASLGADRIINYENEDFTAIGETFDLVFDAVGKTSWFACRALLKKNGIFTATDLGPGWSNIILGIFFAATGSRKVQTPFPDDASGFIQRLSGFMAEGKYRGIFDRSYALDQIVEAFRYVESEQKTGIVVIRLENAD